MKNRGAKASEQIIIRFEQINHGDTGWKDRLYMLRNDIAGVNEACFEKDNR